MKIQKERKEKKNTYTKREKTEPNSKSACVSAHCMAIYRQTKDLEDETRPRVENQHVGPPLCRISATIPGT